MPARSLYTGTERQLLFAFDVGTTYSGISYAVLDPGGKPEIKPVTRFLGSKVGGDVKVPTVIYYRADGVPCAIGAEAEQECIEARAEEEQWIKAEWFKLHLRPRTRTTSSVSEEIPRLPPGKTAVDVFADYLNYMNKCARAYIEERHSNESNLLASGKVQYILSHPNTWEGAQQTLMRRAAVQAGLIADTPAEHERISFVTEGEASLNFCIENGLMNESIERGNGVIIVDAGGGTLDISTYARKDLSSEEFEEITPSESHFKGSVFVTRAAEKHIGEYLQGSRFHEDIPSITKSFDKATKIQFRDANGPNYIKFGSTRDKDQSLGIKAGRLTLDGTTVAGFFEPSINCIVEAVLNQRKIAKKPVSTVFLVGGFAASDYLFAQLQDRLKNHGVDVYRSDAHLNKAVPDGAIPGFLNPSVRTRVAKYTYGTDYRVDYDASKESHVKRRSTAVYGFDGKLSIPRAFANILSKSTQVEETQEFRSSFFKTASRREDLGELSENIICYRGNIMAPEFIDEDTANFYKVFMIHADVSGLANTLEPRIGRNGNPYFRLDFIVIILFGPTEFKAQTAWMENGVEKRGPAEILFDTEIEYET